MKNCFVLMPFSKTSFNKNGNRIEICEKEWNWIFDNWIKKSVESYSKEDILCTRSELIPGNFVKGIIENIINSDVVIADITGNKPNVYYELGIRHGLKNGNVIITQDKESIPSDLSNYFCYCYHYSSKNFENEIYFKDFEKNMHNLLDSVFSETISPDNPVADFKQNSEESMKFLSNTEFKKLIKISPKDHQGLDFAFSIYKDGFSWIYGLGVKLINDLNSNLSNENKAEKITSFLFVLKETFADKEQIKHFSLYPRYQKNFSQNYRILSLHLNEIKLELIKKLHPTMHHTACRAQ